MSRGFRVNAAEHGPEIGEEGVKACVVCGREEWMPSFMKKCVPCYHGVDAGQFDEGDAAKLPEKEEA